VYTEISPSNNAVTLTASQLTLGKYK
jgi:hypothetical protein